jgi:hypothetical protein
MYRTQSPGYRVEVGRHRDRTEATEAEMKPMQVDARKAMERCEITATIELQHMREITWRIKLGLLLIRLAGWVFPFKSEIDVK